MSVFKNIRKIPRILCTCEEMRGRRACALGTQQYPHKGRVTKHFVL